MAKKYSFGNGESRGKFPPPNCRHFAGKIADFHLNYCILKENGENSTSGETVEKVPKSRFDVS